MNRSIDTFKITQVKQWHRKGHSETGEWQHNGWEEHSRARGRQEHNIKDSLSDTSRPYLPWPFPRLNLRMRRARSGPRRGATTEETWVTSSKQEETMKQWMRVERKSTGKDKTRRDGVGQANSNGFPPAVTGNVFVQPYHGFPRH